MKDINEKYYTTYKGKPWGTKEVLIDIFVNPSIKEWNTEVVHGGRGYIDKYGNLYIEGLTETDEHLEPSVGSRVIHVALLRILGDIVPKQLLKNDDFDELENLEKVDKLGVCVIRKGNSNKLYLAESYLEDDVEDLEYLIDELLEKARATNPNLKFLAEVI